MVEFYKKYGSNITSQFGENGIIDEFLNRAQLKFINLRAAEFGAPNKTFCSNINPIKGRHWEKYYFDIDPQEEGITKVAITPENVNEVLPDQISILSIDVDGNDWHIWKAFNRNPEMVIIEVNSSLSPPHYEIPGDRGASYMAMVELGISKGYFLLCHTSNCIFLLNKYRPLFPEITADPIKEWELYFDKRHLV